MKKKLIVMIGTASVLLIGMLVGITLWRKRNLPPPAPVTPIASSGGASRTVVPPAGKHYLQADPRWGADSIGGSGESLAAVGCTVSCVAMAAECLGYPTTPGQLNAALIQRDGFTERGWLKWEEVRVATEGRIDVHVPETLSHGQIDTALLKGHIPVIKFFLPGRIQHWVAIVGKQGQEYLVRDPLDAAQTVVPLSTKTEQIESVRFVMRL